MPDTTSSYFELQLDTALPVISALTIGSGSAFIGTRETTVGITYPESLDDIIQMKIWGDVDPSFDTDVQATEANSNWVSYAASKAIKLSDGDGNKTIYAKIRDNVLNEGAQASAMVTLDTAVPIVAIVSGPTPRKISKIATKDTSEFTFQSSEDFIQYKVCVVSDSSAAEGTGTVIGVTNGSTNMTGTAGEGDVFAANTPISCKIKGADLEAADPGDGKKIIKIFVQDKSGNWSI